jgi:hypothetical protein
VIEAQITDNRRGIRYGGLMLRVVYLLLVIGCGGSKMTADSGGVTDDGNGAEIPTHNPGDPGVGAHGLSFYRIAMNTTTLSSPALATQPTSSTMIVSIGRGQLSAFVLPTDNKGNSPYQKLGTEHPYTLYPNSGTALYAFPNMAGGGNHIVRAGTPDNDEITLGAVEVVDGTRIQQFEWNEVLGGSPITSKSVTTTGPAVLVAYWWGDHDVDGKKTAVPNNGFVVVDSLGESGALVQCFVAVKTVATAGTYNVTWTSTPVQGAQLWLVAVE